MSRAVDFKYKNTLMRLVLDRSFFHDSFRTDYPRTEHAKWIYSYLVHRKAISGEKICDTSSSIISRLEREFKTFPDLKSITILTVLAITDEYTIPHENVPRDHSTIYVAKILWDNGMIPIILSSVSAEKWQERTIAAGIDMGLELEEGMSKKRLLEKIWFASYDSAGCISLFETYDPLYSQIIERIGLPPEPVAE